MKAICAGCNQPVEMKDVPQPKILNDPAVSIVVADHPQHGFCLNCKLPVAPALQGAGLTFIARPVSVEKKSPIVLAPASALPKIQG